MIDDTYVHYNENGAHTRWNPTREQFYNYMDRERVMAYVWLTQQKRTNPKFTTSVQRAREMTLFSEATLADVLGVRR